jgi:tetratricopeptide (TPR) repeat protein
VGAEAPRVTRGARWIPLGLALATFVVYARVLDAEFLRFDDGEYVVDNPAVRAGLTASGARWALTAFHSSNWHPLTWLSHMLDVELFDLDAGRHHAVNVLLHAATAVLLQWFFARATRAPIRSALLASVFALHPLRVQSVAWVSERKDLLAGLAFALLLLAWLRYAERPTRGRYLAALGAFACGLLAKPMLVSAPLVLLVLDRWPLARDVPLRRRLLEQVPFVALALASCLLTLAAQRAGGALSTSLELPLVARLSNACVGVWIYLAKLVWPSGLAYFHPHPALVDPAWKPFSAAALAAAGALVAAALALLVAGRRNPAVLVGSAWTVAMLLPVLGIVQVGEQAWAERYAYLPLVGPTIALFFGVRAAPAVERTLGLLCAVALVPLAVLTWRATGAWLGSEALYRQALIATERNYMAHTGLANVARDAGGIDQARAQYEAALEIRPAFAPALYGLGLVEQERGNRARAIELYERAIASLPGLAQAHLNLGTCLGETGELDRAIEEFGIVLALRPGEPAARANLALVRDRFAPLVESGAADPATRARHARARELLERDGR